LNYYVYYKIDPLNLKDVGPKVANLLKVVFAETRIQGRWLRRRDDPSTYMEVYEDVKDESAFEALLERAGSEFPFQRKVERFIPAEIPS
jgi:hypothetical protein